MVSEIVDVYILTEGYVKRNPQQVTVTRNEA
jgi:hypothetical protein